MPDLIAKAPAQATQPTKTLLGLFCQRIKMRAKTGWTRYPFLPLAERIEYLKELRENYLDTKQLCTARHHRTMMELMGYKYKPKKLGEKIARLYAKLAQKRIAEGDLAGAAACYEKAGGLDGSAQGACLSHQQSKEWLMHAAACRLALAIDAQRKNPSAGGVGNLRQAAELSDHLVLDLVYELYEREVRSPCPKPFKELNEELMGAFFRAHGWHGKR